MSILSPCGSLRVVLHVTVAQHVGDYSTVQYWLVPRLAFSSFRVVSWLTRASLSISSSVGKHQSELFLVFASKKLEMLVLQSRIAASRAKESSMPIC